MKRRRAFRLVALTAGAAALSLAVAAYAYLRSGERVVAFLAGVLQRDYLLDLAAAQPAELALWPEIGLELTGVALVSPAAPGRPVLAADRLHVQVAWRSLFGDTVELTALAFDAPTIDAGSLARWASRYAALDQGPPAPLRVPTVTTEITVKDAAVVLADGAVHRLPMLSISPVAPGRPVEVQLTWLAPAVADARTAAAPSATPLAVTLRATPRDTATGIALDALALESAELAASGRASYDSATSASYAGTLEGPVLARMLAVDGPLAVEIAMNPSTGYVLRADGVRGDAAFAVDLAAAALPDLSQPLEALLGELAERARGTARIDRLDAGGLVLEGVTLEAAPARTRAAEPQ